MTSSSQIPRVAWLRALILVVVLNSIFFVLLGLAAKLPGTAFNARVGDAFAVGALNRDVDYAFFDSRIGVHQYTDCLILQLLINSENDWVRRALGPKVYFQQNYLHACDTLFRLAHDSRASETLDSFRYTRYWHGYYPTSALLLSWFDLQTVRMILKTALYLALLTLPFAAGLRDGATFFLALSITIAGLFFWGVPYYGQSLSHGLGDTVVIAGIALFLLLRRWTSRPSGIILYSAAFGASVTFVDFLMGLLPIAGSYLFAAAFLVTRQKSDPKPYDASLKSAAMALISFAMASLLTVLIKQALAVIMVGPEAVQAFTGSLASYSAARDIGANRISLIYQAFEKMIFTSSDVLTHGNLGAAHVLLAATGLAWVAATLLACINRRDRHAAMQLTAFLLALSPTAMWVGILPNHTIEHSFFISRILVIPISLGWTALLCQMLAAKNRVTVGTQNERAPVEDKRVGSTEIDIAS